MVETFLCCFPLSLLYHLVGAIAILATVASLVDMCLFQKLIVLTVLVPELLIMLLYLAGFCICSDDPLAKIRANKAFAFTFLLVVAS